MAILTIIIFILIILLCTGIVAGWKKWIMTFLSVTSIILSLIDFAVISYRIDEKRKSTFNIIRVDSIHVYKVNETADSLIIENR